MSSETHTLDLLAALNRSSVALADGGHRRSGRSDGDRRRHGRRVVGHGGRKEGEGEDEVDDGAVDTSEHIEIQDIEDRCGRSSSICL